MIKPGQEGSAGFPPLRLGRWGDVLAIAAAVLFVALLARTALTLTGHIDVSGPNIGREDGRPIVDLDY